MLMGFFINFEHKDALLSEQRPLSYNRENVEQSRNSPLFSNDVKCREERVDIICINIFFVDLFL